MKNTGMKHINIRMQENTEVMALSDRSAVLHLHFRRRGLVTEIGYVSGLVALQASKTAFEASTRDFLVLPWLSSLIMLTIGLNRTLKTTKKVFLTKDHRPLVSTICRLHRNTQDQRFACSELKDLLDCAKQHRG